MSGFFSGFLVLLLSCLARLDPLLGCLTPIHCGFGADETKAPVIKVLAWAIVLLFAIVFLFGVLMRKLVGTDSLALDSVRAPDVHLRR